MITFFKKGGGGGELKQKFCARKLSEKFQRVGGKVSS